MPQYVPQVEVHEGALKRRLSNRSRIPPMPGKNRPESLTPAF